MLCKALVVAAVLIESFLLGSIPWGVVISRLFMHDDVRLHGSGNIGTTNMIRAYGKKVGYACFVLDFAKAIVAGLIALALSNWAVSVGYITSDFADSRTLLAVASFGAVFGHLFSPWLGFRGGKGVAAGAGCVLVALGPGCFLIEVAVFALLAATTKYVSVGSIGAAIALPFLALYSYWGNWPAAALMIIVGVTVIWSHRENIVRLAQGTENGFGSKKKPAK